MTPDKKHRDRPPFSGDFADPDNRAWISPEGEVHSLSFVDSGGEMRTPTHFGFADDRLGFMGKWDGSYRRLLKDGWIRKVADHSYHVGHESVIPKVLDHVREHHPEVETARVLVHPGAPESAREHRAHLRFVNTKSGEMYESTTSQPPTSIQWSDPNWMTNREHAWISPEGKYHKLDPNDHHEYWAQKRRGTSLHGLLDKGWIRKADKGIYHVGDMQHIPRVFAHLKERHPEVRRIALVHPGAEYSGMPFQTTFFNRNGSDWSPERNESEEGSKTARAERLLKAALAVEEGAGRGSWLDTRDAGWIAPDDTYHQLPKGDVHDRWIQNNRATLAAHGAPQDALGYDKRAIIGAGWIQKHAANVYSAHDRSAVPRIVKHFTERHPELKRAMVSFKTGGNVYVTRDGTVREPVPYRAEESLQEATERAWIEPAGKVHPVGDAGWFRTHQNWAATDERSPLRGHPDTEKNPFGVIDSLIDRGWVRKGSQESYEARSEKLPLILAHFTKNHPNRKAVHVVLRDKVSPDSYGPDVIHLHRDGSQGRCKCNSFQPIESVNENWMRTREAAWVAPDDTVHPLRQRQFHMHWVMDNAKFHAPELVQTRNGSFDASATEEEMLKHGWFKKQDKDTYHADPSALGRVHKHFTTHHPELDSVHVSGAGRLGTTLRLFRDGRSEKLMYGVNEGWMHSRSAAWIDPDDNVHPLVGGQFHTDWIRANQSKIHPAHKRYYGREDADGLDSYGTRDLMLGAGWIRKQDSNSYNVADLESTRERIIKHVRQHHPRVERVRVNEPSRDSWVDILPEKVDEAWRGGPLDRWLATRTAGWIAPDHTYHQLNPGEHHREWSTNPRNSRHLRDVLRVIDPVRHWDANVVQHEMMKQGWIRKLDHDQYLVGRRSMVAQALRHHERFHPHKNRVEVAVENYPGPGMLHRFYFQRDPNTREILPRRDWRERRRLRKSQQERKWGSSA